MPDNRVTYRRRHAYNTRSNRFRLVKTPGSKLAVHYIEKRAKGVCAPHHLGGGRLQGLQRKRKPGYRSLKKHERRISRPYGGVLTHSQVKERILRAFLIEEQKIVKRVLKMKKR